MYRTAILLLIGTLSVATAAAQSGKDFQSTLASTAGAATASLSPGAPIDAALTKSLDTKKLKPGDPVTAETTETTKEDGTTVIPRGAKLQGHVTQSSSRAKGAAYSAIGIVFDKAILKDGQEVPLSVTVQAIAAPRDVMAAPSAPDMNVTPSEPSTTGASPSGQNRSMPGAQPGDLAPTRNEPNTVANTDVGNAAAGKKAAGGLDATERLTPNSRGVFGMQGIGLAEANTATDQTVAVITSTGKNVHLDSGTQLLLITRTATPAPKS